MDFNVTNGQYIPSSSYPYTKENEEKEKEKSLIQDETGYNPDTNNDGQLSNTELQAATAYLHQSIANMSSQTDKLTMYCNQIKNLVNSKFFMNPDTVEKQLQVLMAALENERQQEGKYSAEQIEQSIKKEKQIIELLSSNIQLKLAKQLRNDYSTGGKELTNGRIEKYKNIFEPIINSLNNVVKNLSYTQTAKNQNDSFEISELINELGSNLYSQNADLFEAVILRESEILDRISEISFNKPYSGKKLSDIDKSTLEAILQKLQASYNKCAENGINNNYTEFLKENIAKYSAVIKDAEEEPVYKAPESLRALYTNFTNASSVEDKTNVMKLIVEEIDRLLAKELNDYYAIYDSKDISDEQKQAALFNIQSLKELKELNTLPEKADEILYSDIFDKFAAFYLETDEKKLNIRKLDIVKAIVGTKSKQSELNKIKQNVDSLEKLLDEEGRQKLIDNTDEIMKSANFTKDESAYVYNLEITALNNILERLNKLITELDKQLSEEKITEDKHKEDSEKISTYTQQVNNQIKHLSELLNQ